jgi:hypothetical protein
MYRIARQFNEYQQDMFRIWNMSPYSNTKPIPNGNRALARPMPDRSSPRSISRVGARYVLQADIAQFYPSIYTHSIAWAAHTKEVAKKLISDPNLFGNILDKEFRASQGGQTKGIAIGPDTSLGIAELLLSQIDYKLSQTCAIHGGTRFIDDIEFTFSRLADAENTLIALESSLHEYELQLNASKTKIIELPIALESVFVTELRAAIPEKSAASKSAWIYFFNRAFDLAQRFPQDGVLRYAVGCLQSLSVNKNAWPLVQSLLWQAAIGDPGVLRPLVDFLWRNKQINPLLSVDKDLATAALETLIIRNAEVKHASEVLWSIWAALLFQISLTDEMVNAIAKVDDSFVAIATCVAWERGLIHGEIPTSIWFKWLEPKGFQGPNWLFCYEAKRENWYPDALAKADFDKDESLVALEKHDVTFVDKTVLDSYEPRTSKAFITSGGTDLVTSQHEL